MEKEYWKKYYADHRIPTIESPFAKDISRFLEPGKKLIELGCGNARDSVYFSNLGVNVLGVDQCEEEIAYLNENFSSQNLSFRIGDFTRLPVNEKYDYVYSRFTLHSVDVLAENRVLDWAYKSLNKGGLLLLEVRSIKDRMYEKGTKAEDNVSITDHYRRFADAAKLMSKLKSKKFKIIDHIESTGLAKHNEEDPVIIRVISQKD